MITHAEAQALVSERLDNPLDPYVEDVLEAHLHDCAECRAFASSADTLVAALRDLPVLSASPMVRQNVWAAIEQRNSWQSRLANAFTGQTAAVLSTAAVALLVITFASLAIFRLLEPGSDDTERFAAGTEVSLALETETPVPTEPPTEGATEPAAAPTDVPATDPATQPVEPTALPTDDTTFTAQESGDPTEVSAPPTDVPAESTEIPADPTDVSTQVPAEPTDAPTDAPAVPTQGANVPGIDENDQPVDLTDESEPTAAEEGERADSELDIPSVFGTQETDDAPTTTPEPTATSTPVPTLTPEPTETPVPTATAVVPTQTPEPTATPEPTITPVPTQTPAPTATPQPTATVTPEPTQTPAPTATPVPTQTSLPTPVPEPTTEPQGPPIVPIDGTSESVPDVSFDDDGDTPPDGSDTSPDDGTDSNVTVDGEPVDLTDPDGSDGGEQPDQSIEPIDPDGTDGSEPADQPVDLTEPDGADGDDPSGQGGMIDPTGGTPVPSNAGQLQPQDDDDDDAQDPSGAYALSDAPFYSDGNLWGSPDERLGYDGTVIFSPDPDGVSLTRDDVVIQSAADDEGLGQGLALCAPSCEPATTGSGEGQYTDLPIGWVDSRLIYQRIGGDSGEIEIRSVGWNGTPTDDEQIGSIDTQVTPTGNAYPVDGGTLIPTDTAWLLIDDDDAEVVDGNPYGPVSLVRTNHADDIITYAGGGQLIAADVDAPGTPIWSIPFSGVDYDLNPEGNLIAVSTGSGIQILATDGSLVGASDTTVPTGSLLWRSEGVIFIDLSGASPAIRQVDPAFLVS